MPRRVVPAVAVAPEPDVRLDLGLAEQLAHLEVGLEVSQADPGPGLLGAADRGLQALGAGLGAAEERVQGALGVDQLAAGLDGPPLRDR